MKQTALVSIIVPIYNTESYLRRSVDSLLNQTYNNIEVWLIDDGSTDTCPAICDEYVSHDGRVRVIHKPNGGEASARNTGLTQATGEYVMFCDSDDEYVLEAVETLFKGIQQNCIDLAIGAYLEKTSDITRIGVASRESYSVSTIARELLTDGNSFGTNYVLSTVNGKLFKNKIIKENSLKFNEQLQVGNDTIFVLDYLSFAEQIYNVFKPTYIYYKYQLDECIQGMAWTYPDYFLFYVDVKTKQFQFAQKENSITDKFTFDAYQIIIDNLIRLMIYAAVYEDLFKNGLKSSINEVINSPLVIKAIIYYKRVRVTDSEFIPQYILAKDVDKLLDELRHKAEKLIQTKGKAKFVRMMYRE